MSELTKNPLLEFESLINSYWSFIIGIENHIQNDFIPYKRIHFLKDLEKSFGFYIGTGIDAENRIHKVRNIVTGFALNANEDQKKFFSSQYSERLDLMKNRIDKIQTILRIKDSEALMPFVLKIYGFLDIYEKCKGFKNPESNSTPKNNPFKDQPAADLFEYIVKNWNYNAATKWGYIWNYFVQQGNGKMTYKAEYESYLIERHLLTKGKPNYELCTSQKRYNELNELKKAFLENLDLN